jgi:hypothetical protein
MYVSLAIAFLGREMMGRSRFGWVIRRSCFCGWLGDRVFVSGGLGDRLLCGWLGDHVFVEELGDRLN